MPNTSSAHKSETPVGRAGHGGISNIIGGQMKKWYNIQTAWLERVKRLHIEQYKVIAHEATGKARLEAKLDLIKLHETYYTK